MHVCSATGARQWETTSSEPGAPQSATPVPGTRGQTWVSLASPRRASSELQHTETHRSFLLEEKKKIENSQSKISKARRASPNSQVGFPL